MKYNKIKFNSLESITDLCELGKKYQTDKSPYNNIDPYGNYDVIAHAYTPFYSILFSPFRYKSLTFGEIGIYKNASIKCWREFFPFAKLYAWDNDNNLIENAKKDNLQKVVYDYMDVQSDSCIDQSLSKTNVKFDILIDDSSHVFWDQIRVIRNCWKYLNVGSILVIEDIDHTTLEKSYVDALCEYGHDKYFSEMTFIETDHKNQNIQIYNNEKLLYFVRNDVF